MLALVGRIASNRACGDLAGVSQISGGIQNMVGGDRYPCEGFRRLEGPLCPAYERISYAFFFCAGRVCYDERVGYRIQGRH